MVARCLLAESGLGEAYWGDAVRMAMILYNWLPHDDSNITPYKAWHSKTPRLDHLCVFGCCAHALIPIKQRLKLGAQSRPSIYLGPSSEHATDHRLLMDNTRAIIVTRDVMFQEHVMPNRPQHTNTARPDTPAPSSCPSNVPHTVNLALTTVSNVDCRNSHADSGLDDSSDSDDDDHEPVLYATPALLKQAVCYAKRTKRGLTAPPALASEQYHAHEPDNAVTNPHSPCSNNEDTQGDTALTTSASLD
jgi:hypothetical protein